MPEGGRPASPRPAGLARARVEAKQLAPLSGVDQRRPGEGGGHVATILGRPTRLGESGWPHSAVSHIPASRGRQAHRPYLLTTDATCFKCLEPTLEAYK